MVLDKAQACLASFIDESGKVFCNCQEISNQRFTSAVSEPFLGVALAWIVAVWQMIKT